MWLRVNKVTEEIYLKAAIEFTSNHTIYGKAMGEVAYLWKNTMENHLTNMLINRKAFIGHCAVFYKLQIPEYIVRMAWKSLTDRQRYLANYAAEQTIKEWELWYMKKLQNTSIHGKKDVTQKEYQTKLQLD